MSTEGAQAPPAPDRRALTAFAGAVLIGGTNFVGVRLSNRELDPLWGAALRFAIAAAIFGVICVSMRLRLPRGRTLALVVAYGLLGFGAAYGLLYVAMQQVSAGVAAVVMAMGPLSLMWRWRTGWRSSARVRRLVPGLRSVGRCSRSSAPANPSTGRRCCSWVAPRCVPPSRSSSRSSADVSTPS